MLDGKLFKAPPTLWWRRIALVLSSLIIVIIIQQFGVLNAPQLQIFIRSSKKISEH